MTAEINVDETENKEIFDVYIRMNGNFENDYCFQVNSDQTFGDLLKIFHTLPIVLSPSIFYDKIPIGFKISTFPGQLTRTGGILFGDDAGKSKYLKSVSNNSKISELTLPGQLIIPVFEERTFLHSSIVAFILVWLYTDLPDFISPTPGICLTNQLSKVIIFILREILNKPSRAQAFHDDIFAETGKVGQCIYFAFHIFKVLLFYFILWAGLFNPYSFSKKSLKSINVDELMAIGWTGAKKVDPRKYQDQYRKLIVAKHGGILKVYSENLFPAIRNCVLELNDGEGFDTKVTSHEIKDVNDGKFYLTKKLIEEQNDFFVKSLEGLSEKDIIENMKLYRQFGPFQPCKNLEVLVTKRFEELDVKLAKENKN